MKPSPEGALRAVIDPCVFARELTCPDNRPVCDAWCERRVLPIVTRRILDHTLGFLRSLGVTRDLLQVWALWLTHRETAVVLTCVSPSDSVLAEYVNACAVAGGNAVLVTVCPDDFLNAGVPGVRVVDPAQLVQLLEKGRSDDD